MTILVLYESKYGNTERIAQAIARGARSVEGAEVREVGEADAHEIQDSTFVFFGAPTHMGTIPFATRGLLRATRKTGWRGKHAAAFDTRFASERADRNAAHAIAERLERDGALVVAPPQGFVVEGMEGPLREGEEARAEAWGREVAQRASAPA